MTISTVMTMVSIFATVGALFLALTLYRYHRTNSVAKRIVWYPIATGLQALNVALSFLGDPSAANVPFGILSRSIGGWLFMGSVLWYLGLYFAGKIDGTRKKIKYNAD